MTNVKDRTMRIRLTADTIVRVYDLYEKYGERLDLIADATGYPEKDASRETDITRIVESLNAYTLLLYKRIKFLEKEFNEHDKERRNQRSGILVPH